MIDDDDYANNIKKLYRILKKCTSKGAARGKVKRYESEKDGAKAYAYLRSYYDQDGDKDIYAQGILSKLMNLTLEYNSSGGMDSYITKFEMWADELEMAGEPLSEKQKRTFFLHGIKDRDYDSVKDQCDGEDYQATVLKLRKKAIQLNKAAGTRNSNRRNNNKQNASNKTNNKGNKKDNNKKLARWVLTSTPSSAKDLFTRELA